MDQEKVTIKINDNGSIRVTGPADLIDGIGDKYEIDSSFSLCRCGQSGKKPFCDGTHKKVGFEHTARAK